MTEKEQLNNLATHLESLLNQRKTWAYEIKAYSNNVEVTFDWDYCYGWFIITPNENGCYEVEDEYLTKNSESFHQHMGYTKVGEFHKCGYCTLAETPRCLC